MHVERMKYTLQPENMPRNIRSFACQDITEDVQKIVDRWGLQDGEVTVRVQHTTCGFLIQEYEDGLLADMERLMDSMAPPSPSVEGPILKSRSNSLYYQHNDFGIRTQNMDKETERPNAHAHLRASFFTSTSEALLVIDGKLVFGPWECVLFFDFDYAGEPRERTVIVSTFCG